MRAGSADESEKSTGLAHYFEHMMFKGNDKIGSLNWEKEKPLLDRIADLYEQHRAEKDPEKRKELYAEIDRLSAEASQYSNNEYWTLNNMMGGSGTNAWTSFDETVYMTDIPSNQLERFLTLEAERFSSIALRRFHTELETVYEEFNLGQDSDSRSAYFALLKLLYGSHPYGRPVIGYPEHLKAPSMKDIQAFFREYYNPCNMALILCGDLDFEQTVDLVEKTFGKLRNQEGAVCTKNTSRRPQASEGMPVLTQMETAAEIFGPEPEFLYIGFRLDPTPRNKVLMRVLSAVLLNGKCGILDEDLLRPQKVQDAGSFPQVQRDSIYHVF